ncbi:hypothetical protein Tco_1486337 [Tanacetum coccineum]
MVLFFQAPEHRGCLHGRWSFQSEKVEDKFFLIDRRAILDYLTWRHTYSCVFDDLPTDGYNLNDVERIRICLIYLRDMNEEVLVHSGLSSVWFNQKCNPVFRRKDDNFGMLGRGYTFLSLCGFRFLSLILGFFSTPLLERIPKNTIAPTGEGLSIPLPTPDEIAVVEQTEGLEDIDMSNFYVEREDSLEGDKSIPVKVVSSPTPHLGSAVGGFAGKPGVEDIRHYVDPFDALSRSSLSCDAEYDEILEDDFATASHSEEIDMTDSDVCRRALDQTITPAELRRTESLLPLELLNRVNVLSALLVSHGMELNTRYANLVASKARTEEKLKRKSGYVKELHSEVATLDKKLERLQRGWSVLDRENKELRSCNDVSFEELKRLQAQFADVEVSSAKLID